MADVALAAGVSKGTASNVFNRPDIVREEVRERVLEAARSLGYSGPDPMGRLLSAGKVNAIGVATLEPISYFFTDPFARMLMAGIGKTCDENGVGISLVSASNEEDLVWNMRSAVVDGFILFCLDGQEKLIALARERQVPAVALAFGHENEAMTVIGIDNVGSAKAAADHLAGLGHRRFGILAMELVPDSHGPTSFDRIDGAVYWSTADRLRGYFKSFREHGIDPDTVPIHETLSDRATVRAALEAMFAAENPPTALLAHSDHIALIALDWLRETGRSVPGDVSVVGFDGVPETLVSDPPLTTIAQPIDAIGQRAVTAILENTGEPVRVVMPTQLVVRGSTAPPPPQTRPRITLV